MFGEEATEKLETFRILIDAGEGDERNDSHQKSFAIFIFYFLVGRNNENLTLNRHVARLAAFLELQRAYYLESIPELSSNGLSNNILWIMLGESKNQIILLF